MEFIPTKTKDACHSVVKRPASHGTNARIRFFFFKTKESNSWNLNRNKTWLRSGAVSKIRSRVLNYTWNTPRKLRESRRVPKPSDFLCSLGMSCRKRGRLGAFCASISGSAISLREGGPSTSAAWGKDQRRRRIPNKNQTKPDRLEEDDGGHKEIFVSDDWNARFLFSLLPVETGFNRLHFEIRTQLTSQQHLFSFLATISSRIASDNNRICAFRRRLRIKRLITWFLALVIRVFFELHFEILRNKGQLSCGQSADDSRNMAQLTTGSSFPLCHHKTTHSDEGYANQLQWPKHYIKSNEMVFTYFLFQTSFSLDWN